MVGGVCSGTSHPAYAAAAITCPMGPLSRSSQHLGYTKQCYYPNCAGRRLRLRLPIEHGTEIAASGSQATAVSNRPTFLPSCIYNGSIVYEVMSHLHFKRRQCLGIAIVWGICSMEGASPCVPTEPNNLAAFCLNLLLNI